MDLVVRNARLPAREARDTLADIGVAAGTIAAVAPRLPSAAREVDAAGRVVLPGLVETHLHLDKSCIMDRCGAEEGTLNEAIAQVAAAKRRFTAEDVQRRARDTLERAILHGTMHMRTQLEVDPGIGLRGLEGVLPLAADYRWAIDLEICVFPQEGLLNHPGTDALMVEALRRGCRVVGAAPYADSDPLGQIDRVFEMAREFDVDIDMHLDFDAFPENMTVEYVCQRAALHRWGGRVTVGHCSKLSVIPPERLAAIGRRLADAGVAVTVMPSTDLYLMGRHQQHSVLRGVAPVHRLLVHGVNCSLSTNNVMNPFTPFGDCSLIRMANLYANVGQVGTGAGMAECLAMVTTRAARLMRLPNYGIAPGNDADLLVIDATSEEEAVARIAQPLYGFKRGRLTFERPRALLHRPERRA